jgi:hypothetical protein
MVRPANFITAEAALPQGVARQLPSPVNAMLVVPLLRVVGAPGALTIRN